MSEEMSEVRGQRSEEMSERSGVRLDGQSLLSFLLQIIKIFLFILQSDIIGCV